jgi:hypothetical protein
MGNIIYNGPVSEIKNVIRSKRDTTENLLSEISREFKKTIRSESTILKKNVNPCCVKKWLMSTRALQNLFMEKPKLLMIAGPMSIYAAALSDRLYVNDNSVDGCPPELLFRTRDGKLYKKFSGLIKHDWAKEILKQLRGLGA